MTPQAGLRLKERPVDSRDKILVRFEVPSSPPELAREFISEILRDADVVELADTPS